MYKYIKMKHCVLDEKTKNYPKHALSRLINSTHLLS